MARRSWDATLGNVDLILAPDQGFRIEYGEREPGSRGSGGTVTFASLHDGLGYERQAQPFRHAGAEGCYVSLPGLAMREHLLETGAFADINLTSSETLALSRYGPRLFWSPIWPDRIFLILAHQVYQRINPDGLPVMSWAPITGLSVDLSQHRFTGSVMAYGSDLIFGIEAAGSGAPSASGYGQFTSGGTGSVVLDSTKAVSFGVSTRGRVFWCRNRGGSQPVEFYWAPYQPGVSFEGANFPRYGPVTIEPVPTVSWADAAGQSVIFFRADASVVGFDEAGVVVQLIRAPYGAGVDYQFGRDSQPFAAGLMFRGHNQLWLLDPVALSLERASPADVQQAEIEVLRRVVNGCASVGAQAIVWQYDSGVLKEVRYVYTAEGITASPLATYTAASGIQSSVGSVTYVNASARSFLIVSSFLDGPALKTVRQYLRDPMAAPILSLVPTTATFTTPYAAGDSEDIMRAVPKLFTGVRFHPLVDTYETRGPQQVTMTLRTETGATQTVSGTVTDQRPVYRSLSTASPLTGRTIRAEVTMENCGILLPIVIDYLLYPAALQRVILRVVAADVPGPEGTVRIRDPWQLAESLRSLLDTQATLTVRNGPANLPVRVEQVAVVWGGGPETRTGAGVTYGVEIRGVIVS